MTAIAKAVSRAFLSASGRSHILKQLAMFCGAALFVALLLLTYGLDLSPGFF
jgi:ribose/xylose/arabinose/galactoside ABC-type transport system permease subunit